MPVLPNHMVRHRFRRARHLSGNCRLRHPATAGAAKEACVVHHRHAAGATGRHRLVAPLPLRVKVQLLPLDTGALALHQSGLAERRHHHPPHQTLPKETVRFLHSRQPLHLPSCLLEILERKTATTAMAAQKTTVGGVILKVMTDAMMLMHHEVVASEENLGIQISHHHHHRHLTEAPAMIRCLLKMQKCLSQVRCCQNTRNVMSASEAATTRAGAVMDAEWITIAHGHRLPPWPACHHAVAWTWICIAWITRIRPAHEIRIAGGNQT